MTVTGLLMLLCSVFSVQYSVFSVQYLPYQSSVSLKKKLTDKKPRQRPQEISTTPRKANSSQQQPKRKKPKKSGKNSEKRRKRRSRRRLKPLPLLRPRRWRTRRHRPTDVRALSCLTPNAPLALQAEPPAREAGRGRRLLLRMNLRLAQRGLK